VKPVKSVKPASLVVQRSLETINVPSGKPDNPKLPRLSLPPTRFHAIPLRRCTPLALAPELA